MTEICPACGAFVSPKEDKEGWVHCTGCGSGWPERDFREKCENSPVGKHVFDIMTSERSPDNVKQVCVYCGKIKGS
jgi:DNA-directed RNA polymerase subunit M/transcription elongation factor TFIIS